MVRFETKGGQIIEIWESRKEALHDIADIIDGMRFGLEIDAEIDETLWIQYKNGSHYCISAEGEEGTFKKTNIEAIIDDNACTTMVWGKYRIENIDDIDEEYNVENDSEEKMWNVNIVA